MFKSKVKSYWNLRLKNKNPRSVITLKSNVPFSYLSKYKKFYPAVIEGLVLFLQELETSKVLSEDFFKAELLSFLEEAEVNNTLDIDERIKSILINDVYYIYGQGPETFNEFRGELLEYIVLSIEKDNRSLIYHEPIFGYKKNPLVPSNIAGRDCLVDVVKVHRKGEKIKLIECKATLDNFVRNLDQYGKPKKNSKKGRKFFRKINFMNFLDQEISVYEFDEYQKVSVEKVFMSLKEPKFPLPVVYRDFKVLNLITLLQNKIDEGKFSLYAED